MQNTARILELVTGTAGVLIALALGTIVVRYVILPGARLVRAVWRFALAPWPAKARYHRVIWYRLRWAWLTRCLGLAYRDPNAKVKHRAPLGPAIGQHVRIERPASRMISPRVSMYADRYGLIADVTTVPKVGRAELENAAEHIGNYWRCVRVQVSQRSPGHIRLRGLDTDPLTIPLSLDRVPEGVYTNPHPFRPYLGIDEWGTHRYLDMSGLSGMTVGGLPGYGKTSFILSLLHQLAGTGAVQFVFIDGKGGSDYIDWLPRAWMHCDDNLAAAASTFEDAHALMRNRLANVIQITGHPNAWKVGPTPDFPLIVIIVDECHTFFDLDAAKRDKQAENYVRTCREMAGQLVKKGRSVLICTILITQKQTSDAIPTAIRDNCRIGASFAVRTKDAGVAALGEGIKEYASYCPTKLQPVPDYIGVMTTSLPTGADPFVRIRVPEISEQAAAQRARETAHLRTDPTHLLIALADEPADNYA